MENQLGNYIEERIIDCNLEQFSESGYEIEIGEPSVETTIEKNKILGQINQKIIIRKEDKTLSLSSFNFEVDSRLGEFYETAKSIYDYQKKNMFLENYSLDVLFTYAPVDGAAINCSPMIWNPVEVFKKLKQALEANIGVLKVSGNYFNSRNTGQYFIVGKGGDLKITNKQINFLYSRDWPSRFEVWPVENNLMVANPVGNQEGLGALGFCYTPYKFVYDLYFPVLIQVISEDGDQMFQFPFAVVIEKNELREAMNSELIEPENDFCDNANTEVEINTYNVNLNPVEADLKFKCSTSVCRIGKSKIDNATGKASLTALVPQCVNGVVIASAKGYSEKKYFISTNEETFAEIILDKEKGLNLEIYVDGQPVVNSAVLTVRTNNENISNYETSLNYPYNKKIDLSEGDYNFDLKVYKAGSITIPETKTRQCSKVPREGILGLFGLEKENCFDITIPGQEITNLFYAGGKVNSYISQSEIEEGVSLKVYASSVEIPQSLDALNIIYDRIERSSISVVVE